MKKIILSVLLVIVLVTTAFILTACSHEHHYSGWEIILEPTCTINGERERYCECGATETEIIWAEGHQESDWYIVTSPTCETEGSKHIKCTKCNKILMTDTILPAHMYEDDLCVFCGCSSDEYFTFVYNQKTKSYTIGANGEAILPEKIILPSTYQGYPILGIGGLAFSQNTTLKEIIIPDSVTTIGHMAFAGCESLTSITIPDSVTTIDDYAFSNCFSLTNITIGNSVTTIGNNAFEDCSSLTSVYITDLSNWCNISFSHYYSNPLYYADNLYLNGEPVTELVIPTDITVINNYAFCNYDSLTSVTIGDNVTSIGSYAFSGCDSLADVYISDIEAWLNIEFGDSYSSHPNYYGTLHILDDNGNEVTDIVIPDGVTTIPDYAFCNAKNITSITIPNSVEFVGYGAFDGCSSLKDVYISDVEAWLNIEFGGYGSNPNRYGTLHILDDNGNEVTDLVIPDGVTNICAYAFQNATNLTSVTIPDSVASIGEGAFNNCSNLKDVYITDIEAWLNIAIDNAKYMPNNWATLHILNEQGNEVKNVVIPRSITHIRASAFRNAKYITNVTIHKDIKEIYGFEHSENAGFTSTTVFVGAFAECSNLTTVIFEEGSELSAINGYAFYQCENLSNITIPDNVEFIGCKAFFGCNSLANIVIPDSVTTISHSAFLGCNSIASIVIGRSVVSIGNYAFTGSWDYYSHIRLVRNNSELPFEIGSDNYGGIAKNAKILISNGNTEYINDGYEYTLTTDGFLFRCKNSKYDLIAYTGNKENVALPININGNSYKLSRVLGVKNVIIPEGVTAIDDYAFYGCGSLISVVIPSSVNFIGDNAFYNCNLNSIIHNGAEYYVEGGCLIERSTNSIIAGTNNSIIPNGITNIQEGAFSGRKNITDIVIPSSVKLIGDKAFYGCYNLANVVIGNSVTSIGDYAFYNCYSLTSITIPDSVTTIGDYAFYYCSSLTSVEIGDSVTSIGDSAFSWCDSLASITIPDSVTSIGDYAFEYCDSLTSVEIGDSVTSIGDYAFYNCDSLTSITIPDSVISIGDYAFYYCSSLTSVTIGDSVTTIGDSAFACCSSLTSVVIGDSVTSIGDNAFAFCNLDDITCNNLYYYSTMGCLIERSTNSVIAGTNNSIIPNGITNIQEGAFSGRKNITDIVIPSSVKLIGDSAFYNCDSLTSITIPDSVISIGDYAFYYCSSLTSVTIGDSVTSIGYKAFDGTAYYNDENNWIDDVLYIGDHLIRVKYYDIYGEYVIKDDTLTIAGGAFEYCDSLTSVVIPDSVASIGDYAFFACYSLASITIPNSVTSIGNSAFYSCNNLKDVYYTGTEEEWAEISIGSDNSYLTNATIHYNYVPEE